MLLHFIIFFPLQAIGVLKSFMSAQNFPNIAYAEKEKLWSNAATFGMKTCSKFHILAETSWVDLKSQI